MPITVATRYGGIYEGGPWATFDVSAKEEIPDLAFAGDAFVEEFWNNPSVHYSVGDSPEESIGAFYISLQQPRFVGGCEVGIARTFNADTPLGPNAKIIENVSDLLWQVCKAALTQPRSQLLCCSRARRMAS